MPTTDINKAIEDIKQGKMVIVVDDADRENEGDLVMAADKVTPEAINFMVTHGRGLVCVPMEAKRLKALQLPLMVQDNTSRLSTAFTISVDALSDTSTGISAKDRAKTIKALLFFSPIKSISPKKTLSRTITLHTNRLTTRIKPNKIYNVYRLPSKLSRR